MRSWDAIGGADSGGTYADDDFLMIGATYSVGNEAVKAYNALVTRFGDLPSANTAAFYIRSQDIASTHRTIRIYRSGTGLAWDPDWGHHSTPNAGSYVYVVKV